MEKPWGQLLLRIEKCLSVTLCHTILIPQLTMAGERKLKRFRTEPRSTLSCYALRLKPGEEIMECLLAYVKDNNLKAPFVLSCVGSVTKATLRMADASRDTTNEVRQHHMQYFVAEFLKRHSCVHMFCLGTFCDSNSI